MTWLTGAEQERVVLALLDGEPMLGMDLLESSGGMLSRGSMYVLLDRMEDAGKVVSWQAGWNDKRRVYAVPATDEEMAMAHAWAEADLIDGGPMPQWDGGDDGQA